MFFAEGDDLALVNGNCLRLGTCSIQTHHMSVVNDKVDGGLCKTTPPKQGKCEEGEEGETSV